MMSSYILQYRPTLIVSRIQMRQVISYSSCHESIMTARFNVMGKHSNFNLSILPFYQKSL